MKIILLVFSTALVFILTSCYFPEKSAKGVQLTSIPQSSNPQPTSANQTEVPRQADTDNSSLFDRPKEEIINVDPIQQDIANNITAKLKNKGINIKSVYFISETRVSPPVSMEFVLQNWNTDNLNRPLFQNYIQHVVRLELAMNPNLQIGAYGIKVLNQIGEISPIMMEAVKRADIIHSPLYPPLKLSDSEVADLISKNITLRQLSLRNLSVFIDSDGFRQISIDLQVSDLNTANNEIDHFMLDIGRLFHDLNQNQNTQVSSYKIILNTFDGKLLLSYIDDLLFLCANWWQDNRLSNDWYPHPSPN